MEPSYNYCAVPLAGYACRADQSKGRIHPEKESEHRTCFQRDRDRIIHASAFRRLKYKTQVFVYAHGDHYRTRLTHTLEVSQIARTLARALHVNEDLAEVVALSHDLGHAPFAHAGEDALVKCMKDLGGFEHNDQSLRVVTALEEKYPAWDGLNLTWETLEGIVKHNGPITDSPLPYMLAQVQNQTDLRLTTYASLEAQIAAISDDIAYNNHDVQDGLGEGLLNLYDLSQDVTLMHDVITQVQSNWPDLPEPRLHAEIIREMIGLMVEDVMYETRRRLQDMKIKDIEDIRMADRQIVAFSDEMFEKVQQLRKYLFANMYKQFEVNRMCFKAEKIINDLFSVFMECPNCLPPDWQVKIETGDKARVICDYIASMTDRYAILEHQRIFEARP